MDARDIVKKYLEGNGFDGLYNDDCGCQISDLFPCDECMFQCKPGYKVKSHETDPEGYDFYIMATKEDVENYKKEDEGAEDENNQA